MAQLIHLPSFSDERGQLTVFEKVLPFDIKRIFYIHNGRGTRGGKKHLQAHQALISVCGSCTIQVGADAFALNTPTTCLLLQPGDPHTMHSFSEDNVLLVLSTEYYNPSEFVMMNPGGSHE